VVVVEVATRGNLAQVVQAEMVAGVLAGLFLIVLKVHLYLVVQALKTQAAEGVAVENELAVKQVARAALA
jgi:hypothetical protein